MEFILCGDARAGSHGAGLEDLGIKLREKQYWDPAGSEILSGGMGRANSTHGLIHSAQESQMGDRTDSCGRAGG